MKNLKLKIIAGNLVLAGLVVLGAVLNVYASDHDDGEMDLKGRALNLTDLFVFREDWQDSSASSQHLIFVMNSNPRSMARQQYQFSTQARYEFHVSRIESAKKAAAPKGKDDVLLGFEFGVPNSVGRQPITMTVIKDGVESKIPAGETTTLADSNGGSVVNNYVTTDDSTLTVFAGLREDPFFFDVERYFRIRGLLATGVNTLGSGPIQGGANVFRSDATAVDFTAGYNVNSIVVRVPIVYLQSSKAEPVFDVWETISVKQ